MKGMRLLKKLLAIMPMMILFCLNGHASTCDSTSLALMEQTWKEFRAIHPFGFQTVGLKHKGDTCVFVMSEPNSWVKEKDLQQLFEKYGGHLIICYQPYGFDGQLTDAVGCALFDSKTFPIFEKELFILLYRTDYKPIYTDLDHPVEHVYFSKKYNLNYNIVRGYEYDFLLELFEVQLKNEKKGRSLQELLLSSGMRGSNEIYYSKNPGFVLWLINPSLLNKNDPTFLPNARRFALDSDLILKYVVSPNKQKIAILAREREVPLTVLPPLRSETIELLTTLPPKDISIIFNSYEGLVSLHDYYDNISKFATLIEICDKLQDTELGNLMILTDVLLKSWSENNYVVDYFIDYPQPNEYPFPKGVAHELGYKPKYMWNFLPMMEGNMTGRLIGTGCLLPSYPSFSSVNGLKEKNEAYIEKIAQKCFANLNCIELIRITQYATLYQAFHHNHNKSKIISSSTYSDAKNSWVQTPSESISNRPWGYGGYQKVKLAITGNKFNFPEYLGAWHNLFDTIIRPLFGDPYPPIDWSELFKNLEYSATSLPVDFLLPFPSTSSKHVLINSPQNDNLFSKERIQKKTLRQIVVNTCNRNIRGCDVEKHNPHASPNEVLSESQIQKKLDKAAKSEERLIEIQLEAIKYGILPKHVRFDKKNTKYIVIIYNSYEKQELRRAA